MSELFDEQVNASKEKDLILGFMQAHKKVCNENETNKEEKMKNVFIRHI